MIATWVAAAVAMTLAAPSLNEVGSQDPADFLPTEAPSQQANRILAGLFADDPTREAAIIVVAAPGGLTEADRAYVRQLAEDLRSPLFPMTSAESTASPATPIWAPSCARTGAAELLLPACAGPSPPRAPRRSRISVTTRYP